MAFGIFFGSIYLCRVQLLSLSCTTSISVVDDIHMVVMGLLLIFEERCLGLSFFYATFVSYYYRWQTPLCCELCDLHSQSLLHTIIAVGLMLLRTLRFALSEMPLIYYIRVIISV